MRKPREREAQLQRTDARRLLAKSALGCLATGAVAWLNAEPLPAGVACAVLVAIGGSGYGLSLRFYLLAQRTFGAARTGSVFASEGSHSHWHRHAPVTHGHAHVPDLHHTH